MNNYCIKPGYRAYESELNMTHDDNRSRVYWDHGNKDSNLSFQWSTYLYAKKQLDRSKIQTIIDIGCGPALKARRLFPDNKYLYYGIDQESSVNIFPQLSNFHFLSYDLDNPDYSKIPEIRADIIICSDVIEHLIDPDKLLDLIKYLALPSTTIIFSTPCRDSLRGIECMKSEKPEHIREWNRYEFITYLSMNGFTIRDSFLASPMRPTIKMIKTYLIKRYRALKNPAVNFNSSHIVNAVITNES